MFYREASAVAAAWNPAGQFYPGEVNKYLLPSCCLTSLKQQGAFDAISLPISLEISFLRTGHVLIIKKICPYVIVTRMARSDVHALCGTSRALKEGKCKFSETVSRVF